ncbi:GspE/PulE family protein [Crateriforma conspicua]|uniref:Putative type II secretion system protein E n=1 Tax=Crateriforma conspicua TaxID=2527996 RepID=A0A5C6FSA2_9PLAN|nr:ATPase, T2SS/T4P/T4SS family [Crateriforma conspicua]TWU65211.1 putative type II secretion system protein E [Crateriforma conspicua]
MSMTSDDLEIDFREEADLQAFDPEAAARELVTYAVSVDATDVFLTDESTSVVVRLRRMGQLETVQRLSHAAGRRLQNHFRAVSGAYVTDQMKPVEGRELLELDDGRMVDVRINALPSIYGYDLALRIFGSNESILSIDQLGIFASEADHKRQLLDCGSGLVLVSGPTGSGKTHSLYSFLKYLQKADRKIHTIEDPIEHVMNGIVQSQVNVRGGIDFAQLLAAILRHSPDVIMIGEIRDARAAEVAVRAAGSGHLVLASVHARTAAGAVHSMLSYGVLPHFLASSLVGVVAQRLVRRLCPHCRQRISMSDCDDFLSDLRPRLPDDMPRNLWLPVGCDRCVDGYDRLVCLPEIIRVTPSMRDAIQHGSDEQELARMSHQAGNLSLETAGRLRLATGWTTAEELIRVLPEDDHARASGRLLQEA